MNPSTIISLAVGDNDGPRHYINHEDGKISLFLDDSLKVTIYGTRDQIVEWALDLAEYVIDQVEPVPLKAAS